MSYYCQLIQTSSWCLLWWWCMREQVGECVLCPGQVGGERDVSLLCGELCFRFICGRMWHPLSLITAPVRGELELLPPVVLWLVLLSFQSVFEFVLVHHKITLMSNLYIHLRLKLSFSSLSLLLSPSPLLSLPFSSILQVAVGMSMTVRPVDTWGMLSSMR